MKKRTGKMISLSLAVAMAVTAAPVTALAVDEPVLTTAQSAGETGTDTTTEGDETGTGTTTEGDETGTGTTTEGDETEAGKEVTSMVPLASTTPVDEQSTETTLKSTETEKTVQGKGTKENPYKVSTETELKEAVENGGYLQMSGSFEINGTLVIENDVNLDLNGNTLTCNSNEIGIQVKSGSTLIEDSADNGKITTNGRDTVLIKVSAGAELTLKSGTLENTDLDLATESVIYNYGTLNIDGGVIEGVSCVHANASQYETNDPTTKKSIVNITNGQLIGMPCETDSLYNQYTDVSYGLTWYGLGMGEKGNYNKNPNPINDAVVINISGGKISGGQALGTNASSGKYAGFTLNISDDAEIISSTDCAAYLPGYGITNISGGKLSGPQGIRIAAGELNITGGTIEGTSLTDGKDLQSGGSGGTLGAIVVGKASGGYLGNIDVNISNGAVIQNTATNGTDDARPAAIVVSDKNMANSEYENSSINVTTEDIEITGDIIKISNLTSTTTSDGGETVLDINNTTVTGSVINQSKSDLNMTSSEVTGDMTNKDKGNTFVSDSKISGTVKNSGTGAVAVTGNSTVGSVDKDSTGSIFVESDASSDVVALVNGIPYKDLQTAVNEAPDNAKITLVKNVEVNHAVTIPAGVTLDSSKNTTITLTTKLDDGAFITAGGDNVTIRNITINTNGNAKHGVQFYCVKGGEMDKVTVNGGYYTSVIVNGAEATIKNSILNLDAVGYANIEFAVGKGVTTVPKVTIENVTTTPDKPVVYMDNTTFTRIQDLEGMSEITREKLNANNVTGAFLYYNKDGSIIPNPDTLPTITFNPTEGSIADSAKTQKINTSGHLDSLPTASRSGYRLDGWYTEVEGGEKITTDTLFTKDTTVYAQWSKKSSSSSRYDGYITIINPKNGEVSVSDDWAYEDDKITLTITPDDGYEVDKIEIVDDEGDKIDAKKVDDEDNKYTFRMANCDVTVTVTFKEEGKTTEDTDKEEDKDDEETTELNFTDVKESDWFYKGVEYVVDKDIMSGVSENEFAPSGKLTRAMLVQMLYNMESRPACDAENAFMDVPVGQWYTDAVIWANDEKIVSGMGDGLFAPNMEITREQMVAMLYNYAKYKGYDVTASADLSAFADTASVSAWAQPAMQWAVAEGYISGMGDSQLAPQGTATRAEIASVIMRFMEATAKTAE